MSARKPKKDEIAALKAENAELKAQVNQMKAKKRRQPIHILRIIAVGVFIVVAALLLAAANLFFWTGNTIVKQDRFVAATSPIIKDPEVQKAAALYTTNNIFQNIDVQQQLESVLPPRADFLAPQLTSQLKSFTNSSLQKVLANPAFQDKWNSVMAKQHQRLIDFGTKYNGNGDISINDIFNQLTASLGNTKLAFLSGKQLPPKVGDITVVSAPWLPKFHNLITHIDAWRFWSAVILVVLVGAGVWLSRNRRRVIYWFGALTSFLMLLTLVILHATRDRITSKVDPQYAEGVRHAIQIVFHSLVLQTITILCAGLVIIVIAWITGGNRGAMALKKQVGLVFSGKLHQSIFGDSANGFILWLSRNKRAVQWSILGLTAITMLLVRLTLKALFIYLVILVILELGVEVIAGQTKPSK